MIPAGHCVLQALTEEAAADVEEGALLGGSGGRKRARVRDSFFLWFEEQKPRGDAADADDPVADIFKEQIWVNPLKWYMEQPEVGATVQWGLLDSDAVSFGLPLWAGAVAALAVLQAGGSTAVPRCWHCCMALSAVPLTNGNILLVGG